MYTLGTPDCINKRADPSYVSGRRIIGHNSHTNYLCKNYSCLSMEAIWVATGRDVAAGNGSYTRGNKSSNQGLSLNRSQCGGCSTEYNTLTSSQVVCKWFCAPTLHRVWSGFSNRRTVTYDGETAYWGRICVGTAAAYVRLPTLGSKDIVAITRWDSDLEAFSHKPSDGSFAPLACRPSTWTNCLNLRFLSYWAGLLLQQQVISRVKLTCLTTV